jgi:hypothetical protein
MDDAIASVTNRLKDIVKEIRGLNPDKNWLLQNYWISSNTFPEQAITTRTIVDEIVGLNPTHLRENEVSQRVIHVMIQAVWEDHFDDNEFFDELRATIAFLVNYQGSQEIHIQLQNVFARSTFELGGVTVVPIPNHGDLTEYNLKYDERSFRSNDETAVNAYARVVQAPGLGTAASWNAISETERVLKILRGIGLPTLWGREWGQMGVTGRVVGSDWTILRTQPGFWSSGVRTNLRPGTWYMDLDSMLQNYTNTEIQRVKHIYETPGRSKMENKALQALLWLGEATFPGEIASKFAHLAIAFESAIGGEASDDSLKEIGITQMLAERTAFLLGNDRQTRLHWHRFVVRLYGSRSRVMHGEADPVSLADLNRWVYLVWSVVRAMLRLSLEISTVEELAAWIREQRYA